MQPVSEKTFHLKWNNHLQNLSQLFTAIYSSAALADVTLACRDGSLRAHKLVLSACSPYFEQIFKENPCKHPVVILKGIPFSEINLLVEFMYKGSVDVQELDLQSLMHTASELEIRGLAYEVRANAAQLLNVNLEYPTYTNVSHPAVSIASTYDTQQTMQRTDMERLKQIHLYQQSMLREAEIAKRKKEQMMTPNSSAAVKSILAAAAKEMADGREKTNSGAQTEERDGAMKMETSQTEDEGKPKKRVSIFTPEEEKLRKKKLMYSVKQSPQHDGDEDGINKLRITAVASVADNKITDTPTGSGIKVVNISSLQATNQHTDDEESGQVDDDDSCTSSGEENMSEAIRDSRPHVCDVCDIRFQRASHLSRHRLTHTGERPFTCGGCGKSFARSDKLRVHTKICERDDPMVDIPESEMRHLQADGGDVTSGTVRVTHKDTRALMFTPSGDIMLAPRGTQSAPAPAPGEPPSVKTETPETPLKRGRGRPKKPIPEGMLPKVKKRRGRPPKALSDLEMMMGMGNGGLPPGLSLAGLGAYSLDAANSVPMQQHVTPTGQHLLVKRKRGRPPKNYFNTPVHDGGPKENYNATNLPFGDFSYLTEMKFYPGPAALYQQYERGASPAERGQAQADPLARHGTIDVSSSSSDDGTEDSGQNNAADFEAPACETEVMTVGECQITKVAPPAEGDGAGEAEAPRVTVGDCTILPVESEPPE